ncbi:MAG: PaaI family thioesterase [Sphingobacteriales bacterium]|nr:MAG: PaaI family thioesterase [Sphingobacteriales bacterium]
MSYREIPAGSVLQYIKEHFEGRPVTDSRSPAGNWLGFTLDSVEKGKATISLEVRHEMTNPYYHIHGGMMSLLIDEVIGWAVISLDSENFYTSLNLNVDFLFAIKQGERLKATAQVVRAGKKIIHVECHVYDMKERLLAKAASNLIATGMRPAEGEMKVAN